MSRHRPAQGSSQLTGRRQHIVSDEPAVDDIPFADPNDAVEVTPAAAAKPRLSLVHAAPLDPEVAKPMRSRSSAVNTATVPWEPIPPVRSHAGHGSASGDDATPVFRLDELAQSDECMPTGAHRMPQPEQLPLDPEPERVAPAPRRRGRSRRVLLFVALLFTGYVIEYKFHPRPELIRLPTGARLAKLSVARGAHVMPGDLLAELQNPTPLVEQQRIDHELRALEVELSSLGMGPHPRSVDEKYLRVQQLRAQREETVRKLAGLELRASTEAYVVAAQGGPVVVTLLRIERRDIPWSVLWEAAQRHTAAALLWARQRLDEVRQ